MADKVILRDSHGRWLPGSNPNPGGQNLSRGHRLTDLVKQKFGDDMEVYIDKQLTRKQRKEIMAEALAQLISTGEIHLPDRLGADGEIIHGKVFKYNSGEYMRQMIRVLRYVEPPVQEVAVSGGVEGIVFDNEFLQQANLLPADTDTDSDG